MKDHTTKGLIIEEIQVTLWLQGFLWCIQLFNTIQIWLQQNNLFWTLKLNAIKKRNKQNMFLSSLTLQVYVIQMQF